MWSHFDTGGCPGQAVGVRTRLDNGVSGFISLKNLSDKHVTNPEERVQVGQLCPSYDFFVLQWSSCIVRWALNYYYYYTVSQNDHSTDGYNFVTT